MSRVEVHPRRSPVDLRRVETPAAVVDRVRMQSNADRVVAYCRRHGLAWRPHIKTHKSTRVARLQLDAGASGLTVATPREAEVMAQVSDDLLLAYPPVGEARLRRIVALPSSVRLSVAVDSTEVLLPLARAARDARRGVRVLVEVDVGLRRVGVQGVASAVELAESVAAEAGVEYAGILFYAGHIREPGPEADEAMRALDAHLGELVEALSAAGCPPEVVSGGTTPTLWRSHELKALTEVRAGTCIFNDRDALSVGAAGPGDLAYTVLATVVSTAVEGRAAVDAGSKALAKEARGGEGGFGVVVGRPEVRVAALSEEHGMLDLSGSSWRPRVGERVRIVPNHVCVSANLQDHLLVGTGDEAEIWAQEARGRLPFAADDAAPAGGGAPG